MYKRRLYTFIFLCAIPVVLCLFRLAYLQFGRVDEFRESINSQQILDSRQLPTVRGNIIDRYGNELAIDEPSFNLYISYSLTRLRDDRYRQSGILLRTNTETTPKDAEVMLDDELKESKDVLQKVLDICSKFENGDLSKLEERIDLINNRIWKMREFFAWKRYAHDSPTKKKYEADPSQVSHKDKMEDLAEQYPDIKERLKLISDIKLAEMNKKHRLVELNPDTELYDAQQQINGIIEVNGKSYVEIAPEAKRKYPYGSSAAQIIGWVGSAREADKEIFADDDYARYLENEVSGISGVEKVCEVLLRGRRGEVTYDHMGNRIDHKETQYGKDVRLSIDIRLQQRIESFLSDPNQNPYAFTGIGAVVLDVARGDVLAMVSVPVFDLNTVKQNYNYLLNEAPNQPLRNKAMEMHYPPGSTIKPALLAIGLDEKKTWAEEIISCPSQKAPKYWPNCQIFLKSKVGHDVRKAEGNNNYPRDAIRYSCNVFFSNLANRFDPNVFQKRFFSFGYGHKILPGPFGTRRSTELEKGMDRFLPESTGYLCSGYPKGPIKTPDDLPALYEEDLKQFGIGQGNFMATVLQVANVAAVIARGGIYKDPRLFLNDSEPSEDYQLDLGLSEKNLDIVRDGMRAVVTEQHGTGYSAFRYSDLIQRDVKVFGKTGSTQVLRNAWFMCFAEDNFGRAISLALVVEKGESGTDDAAPLARRILELCNEAGYIGKKR